MHNQSDKTRHYRGENPRSQGKPSRDYRAARNNKRNQG
jgi:hypothetical protein